MKCNVVRTKLSYRTLEAYRMYIVCLSLGVEADLLLSRRIVLYEYCHRMLSAMSIYVGAM